MYDFANPGTGFQYMSLQGGNMCGCGYSYESQRIATGCERCGLGDDDECINKQSVYRVDGVHPRAPVQSSFALRCSDYLHLLHDFCDSVLTVKTENY